MDQRTRLMRASGKQPQVALSTIGATLSALDQTKANASTVGGILTRISFIEQAVDGKADTASVTALPDSMPIPADEVPRPEQTGGSAGFEGRKVSGAGHHHPRLTSATMGMIGTGNVASVMFTRHTRRSDTSSTSRTWSMQRLRRAGLRSSAALALRVLGPPPAG